MTESKTYATLGLIFGILSIPGAIIPLLGFPLSILGIIFSKNGMKEHNGKAIAGLVCSIVGISLTALNSFIGALSGYYGKNEFVNSILS